MTSKRKKIGIFDSGIGGFSILKKLVEILPGHEFYYVSDFPHSPYGNKSTEYIQERCQDITDCLLNEGVDLILLACNTATAASIDLLRSKYSIPFVGIEPFVKSIESLDFKDKKLKPVVLTTVAMGESERFKSLMKRYDPGLKIHHQKCPHLASLIEKAFEKGQSQVEIEIEQELKDLLNKGYTHAILGCTHYPLIEKKIESYLTLKCISPCLPVAKRVAQLLEAEPLTGRTELYFKTSDEESFKTFEGALLSLG
ncbi:MAG: glutamate racemase [Bacteriovoracaceae bacterium]|jgi:glutamate racemase